MNTYTAPLPFDSPVSVYGWLEDTRIFRLALRPVEDNELASMTGSLSAGEQAVAQSFQSQRVASHYVQTRHALRQLIAEHVDCDPSLIPISVDANGKPFMARLRNKPALQFSNSRSQDLALIAFARTGDLGVDIEVPSDRIDVDLLVGSALSDRELENYRAVEGTQTGRGYFYRLWTAKEAILKACGVGLRFKPNRLCLARFVGGNGPARYTPFHLEFLGETYLLIDLSNPDYFAALAISRRGSHSNIGDTR